MSEHAIQTKCLLKAVDPARVAAVGPWRVPVALTAAAGADDRCCKSTHPTMLCFRCSPLTTC